MTDEGDVFPGLIDPPGPFASLEVWTAFLEEMENCRFAGHPQIVRVIGEARDMVAEIKMRTA